MSNYEHTQSELNARLLNLIDWIGTVGKEIEAGAREQMPELAREIIVWGFWSNVLWSCFWATGAVVFLWAAKKAAAYFRSQGDEIGPVVAWMFLGGATIGCFIGSMNCAFDAVKVKVAPSVYLVETASKWLKL